MPYLVLQKLAEECRNWSLRKREIITTPQSLLPLHYDNTAFISKPSAQTNYIAHNHYKNTASISKSSAQTGLVLYDHHKNIASV